jgi:hypothetical protein
MRPAPLSPAQAAALRRARELAAELTELTASIRAVLRAEGTAAPLPARFEPPVAEPAPAPEPVLTPEPLRPEPVEDEAAPGLAAGELRAAFAAAKPRTGPRRRPRELFGH